MGRALLLGPLATGTLLVAAAYAQEPAGSVEHHRNRAYLDIR